MQELLFRQFFTFLSRDRQEYLFSVKYLVQKFLLSLCIHSISCCFEVIWSENSFSGEISGSYVLLCCSVVCWSVFNVSVSAATKRLKSASTSGSKHSWFCSHVVQTPELFCLRVRWVILFCCSVYVGLNAFWETRIQHLHQDLDRHRRDEDSCKIQQRWWISCASSCWSATVLFLCHYDSVGQRRRSVILPDCLTDWLTQGQRRSR